MFKLVLTLQSCQLYDIIELPDSVTLMLEMVSGVDLFTFLQNQPKSRVDPVTLKDIVIQLLAALDYMHSQGVLHRDLKLDNMMLTSTGILKIIDFNLGIALEPGQIGQVGLRDAVGTPQFASPLVLACGLQQQQNKLLERRGIVTSPCTYLGHGCIDLWSLGVCINGLATGRFPFHAKDAQPLLQEIKEYAVGHRRIYFPSDLPPIIKDFIQRILAPHKSVSAKDMMVHPWLVGEFEQETRPLSPETLMVETCRLKLELLQVSFRWTWEPMD
jgi:serine/threonine protein kinase